jgi:hypothetical protein
VNQRSSKYQHFINSFQAMAPLTGHEKGVHFWGELFPSKMGPFSLFLATIQPLSSARAFLSGENERKLLCMGRTLLNIEIFTNFYTSRVRFPTDAQLFRAIIKRQGLISSEAAAHTQQLSLIIT